MKTFGLRELVVFVLVAAAILVFVGPALGVEKASPPVVGTETAINRLLGMLEKAGAKAVEIGERAADGAGTAASYAWPRLVLLVWAKALGAVIAHVLSGVFLAIMVVYLTSKAFGFFNKDDDSYISAFIVAGVSAILFVVNGVALMASLPDYVAALIAPDAVLMHELLQKIKF